MLHDVSFAATSSLSPGKGTCDPGQYLPWEITQSIVSICFPGERKSCYLVMLQNPWPQGASINHLFIHAFIHSIWIHSFTWPAMCQGVKYNVENKRHNIKEHVFLADTSGQREGRSHMHWDPSEKDNAAKSEDENKWWPGDIWCAGAVPSIPLQAGWGLKQLVLEYWRMGQLHRGGRPQTTQKAEIWITWVNLMNFIACRLSPMLS